MKKSRPGGGRYWLFVYLVIALCREDGLADSCPAPNLGPVSYYGLQEEYSEHIGSGDFNGDGILDLVTSDRDNGSISVLLCNGNGTFQPPIVYPAGHHPEGVASGDVNGDHMIDIVVTSEDGFYRVFLGKGDGTFTNSGSYSNGGYFLVLADVNNDGKLDIIWERGAMLGKGDGTFLDLVTFSAGSDPTQVAVADLNHDGKLDVAVGDFSAPFVSVLLGNGDGTFQQATGYAVPHAPHAVAIGEFNGDTNLDLAASIMLGNSISVLIGNGDGTFRAATNFNTGTFPRPISVADFNADGKADLAVGTGDGVSILLGNGAGSFPNAVTFSTNRSEFEIPVGDFNRDGAPDVAGSYLGAWVLLNGCSQRPPAIAVKPDTSGVKVSWSSSVNEYVLKSTTSLSVTNWQPVVQIPVTNNAFLEVTVPVDAVGRYFRLFQP